MLAGVNAAPFDIDIAATRGVIAITGASGTATAYRSAFDPSGNSFVVGAFTGTVDFDPGSGTTALSSADGNDGFVAKYSPQGALLWARRFGGPGDDRVNAVAVSESGAVYFGGRFDTAASFDSQVSAQTLDPVGGPDGFVGSFAADGSLTWIDGYGGGQYDEIDALAIQPDGNVVAVGSFDSTVDFDRGPESQTLSANNLNDVFVLSLTSSGDYRWVKQFAGSGYQYPRDAATGTDGRIVVTGSFYGTVDFDPGPGETLLTATPGLTSAFIVQLDASGGLVWAGNLGGSMQFGEAITVDAAGAVYASGVAWGPTDFAFGPTVNSKSFSGTRVYLTKYDAAGGHEWARTFLKNDSIYGSFLADRALGGVEVDSSGKVYLAGGFSGTVDFDDSAIDQSETASGTEDAYVLKWSAATGELQAVRTFGGSGSDRADGISVSPFGQLIVSGTFASSVDFGTESPTASLGSSSGFVVVLGNQSPTNIALSASSIAENQPVGMTVGTLTTTDPDVGDSFTYTVVSGSGSTDNASFVIVGSELRTAEVFDFEAKASYSIRVRATDQSGLFTEKAFAIDVGDVDESPVDIESGLVARYRFNGNATDSSGNGRNGIMKDTSPTIDRFGVASGALSFNGASSWVEVPHAQPLNSFPITVSAWFQSTADNPGHIVSKYENATWNGWGISVEKARVQPNSASGYYLASRTDALISLYDDYPPFEAGESLNNGTWHHIVMVVDQTSGRLYLDGVLADTQSWRGTPSAATASWPMFFGYYPHSYVGIGDMNPYFSGSIDDVRIYSRALTAEEIDLLHTTELVPNGPPTEIVLSASSIAENQPTGMTVGTLSTTDPDAGDSFTYALVNGDGADDNASFTIVGGVLKASESFDYETKSSYSIRVRSTDLGGFSVDDVFVIKVVNLGEGATDLRQGLVARYELDGNAADASGNGRHGVVTNAAPATDRFGRANAALSFNGIDSVVVVPHDSSLNALPLSVSVWFQTTATTGGIVGKYQAAGWDGYQLSLGNGGTVWPWYVLSRGQDVIGNYDVAGDNNPAFRSAPLNDGLWHNVVFTVDASGGALFVDGALQATKEWRGDPTSVTTNLPLFIGQYFGEQNGFFTGLIDDVRIYDRVLSPEEVSLLNAAAPTGIALSAGSVAENQPAGTVVGTLSTADPDAGDTFTYTLVGGDGDTDNASFKIVGDTLETTASFDYETQDSYSIRIRSTDRAGLFTEKALTIAVTDLSSSLYWLSGGKIYSGVPDGGLVRVVVAEAQTPGAAIMNVAVDAASRRIYWTEQTSVPSNSLIYSSNLFGNDVRAVYTGDALGWVNYGMAVDGAAGYVFLHSHDPAPVTTFGPHYDGRIQRIDIATGTVGLLPSAIWYARLFVDPSSRWLYYTDVTGFGSGGPNLYQYHGLKRSNYDGTEISTITVQGEVPTGSVSVDVPAAKIFYATAEGNQARGVYSSSLSGGASALVVSTNSTVRGVAVDGKTKLVFWIDDSGVHQANFDGTNATLLYSADLIGSLNTYTSGFAAIPDDSAHSPTQITLAPSAIAENQPAGTVVGTLSTTDPDAGDAFTYTLVGGDGDTDNASFKIVGDTLETTASFDFETQGSYSIRIRATDSSGLFIETTMPISVADVNESPTGTKNFITFDAVAGFQDFAKYSEAGMTLTATPGEVRISDAFSPGNNAAQPSFGFGQGMDSKFVLQASDGRPFSLLALNVLEATVFPQEYSVVVTGERTDSTTVSHVLALDGISGAQTFFLPSSFTNLTSVIIREDPANLYSIDIAQIDDVLVAFAPVGLSLTSIAENEPAGAIVGTLSTTDPDTGDSFTYALASGNGDADNALFTIADGMLKTSASFDYEVRNSYSIRVRTTDQGGLFTEEVLTVSVTDVAEPPTDIALSSTMVGEGLPIETVVGLLSTTDEDVGDSFTYALVPGEGSADNASFTIRDGELLTAETFTAAVKGTYSIRLQSTDAAGYTFEKAFTITVLGKPGRPTGLAGVPGNGTVKLAWTAPVNDGGAPIVDYLIEFKREGSTTWSTFDRAPSSATSANVTGLSNYVRYVFRVSAVNVAGTGQASVASAVVMPLPLPGTPTGLTGRPGDGRVTLVWAAPPSAPGVPRVVDYVIQVSRNNGATWTTFADGVSAGSSTTVTGLTNGTAYVFRVSAMNSAGIGSPSDPSAPVTPRSAPGSPTSLKATPGDAQVALSWTMPVSNGGVEISDYVVQWSVNGLTWVTFADGVSTATTATVTGLANGTAYMFRVAAQNVAGVGLPSPSTTRVTPYGVPGSPTGVSGIFGDSQVKLTWKAPISTGGAPITDYKIEYQVVGSSAWATFARARSSALSAVVTGLTNGQSYLFRVSAINLAGAGEPAVSAPVMPRTVPGVPQNLFVAGGPGQASLSWTAPASDGGTEITNYAIEHSLNNGASWTLVRRPASTALTATITGLTNGLPYVFRVTAVNMSGSGRPTLKSAVVIPLSFTSLETIDGVEFGFTQLGYAFRESDQIRHVTSGGRNVRPNQLGTGWTMRAVWASAGGGYQAYWRSSTGASALWTLNSTGAFVSTQTLSASQVTALEVEINFDLDKNGTVGP